MHPEIIRPKLNYNTASIVVAILNTISFVAVSVLSVICFFKEKESGGDLAGSVKGRGNFVARAKDVKQTLGTAELYTALEKAVTELKFLGESSENIEMFVKNICMKKEENQ